VALEECAWIDGNRVYRQADLTKLRLEHGDRALADCVPLLCEDREPRRVARRILNEAVTIAVDEPDGLEQRTGFRHIARRSWQIRDVPVAVAGRDRGPHRLGSAEIDSVNDGRPIDGERDRTTELGPLKP